MKQYVLGFYYTPQGVILIHKHKPAWQQGLCNGLGGSIGSGETPHDAIVREFREESGINTQVKDWRQFATLNGPTWQMYVFACQGDSAPEQYASCDEGVVNEYCTLPDNMERTAHWLCLMGRDATVRGVEVSALL